MKTMKKFASLALALIMMLALAIPAMAANDGSITINNAEPGQQYTIYKLFDLTYGSKNDNEETAAHTYSILSTSPWYAFVSGEGQGAAFVTLTESDENVGEGVTKYYVAWNEGKEAAEFAKLAIDYATTNNVDNQDTKTAPAAEAGKETSTVSFTDLELGYYLIDSTMGALCSLDTTNRNVDVTEKNDKPSLEKEIVHEGGNCPGVGDTVKFQITVNAQPGAENYVVHDQMTNGLTFNSDSVAINGLTKGTDYTVKTSGFTDDCTFHVEFAKTYLDTINTKNTAIVITYSATINANAVTEQEKNKAILKYGDPNHTIETIPSEVDVPVYHFDLVKTSSDGTKLDGATFTLYDAKTDGNQIALVQDGNFYRPATVEEKAADGFQSAVIKTTDGVATIKGLGKGTYWLQEETAPEGYNKLKGRQEVNLTEGSLNAKDVPDSTQDGDKTVQLWGGVQVINLTGAELPSTGGIGTTIFYIVGGVLIVGAVVLLVTKKRVSAE